jgi:hypothetical protein
MGKISSALSGYLLNVFKAALTQLLLLLGPLLLLAIIMNLVAKGNENLSYRVFGTGGFLYVFGWLGTAVHEIGHAAFALLFGHKINEMVLFSPNSHVGSLGHVSHSYNPNSVYQSIGNFFIGIGPILFGSLLLYLITYLLFGYSFKNRTEINITSKSILSSVSFINTLTGIWDGIRNYFSYVFTGPKTSWWKILVLTYFLYAIGSSITLSPSDIAGAIKGLGYFAGILFLFNLVTLWMGSFAKILFLKTSLYFSGFYFLIILSIFVNILFIIILLTVDLVKSNIA